MDIKVKAINKIHQAKVNKAVYWLNKYEDANTQRDIASENNEKDFDDECVIWRKYDRMCEKSFDRYLDYMSELPKREQNQIEKLFINI